jgi:hypothetical protein
MQISNKFEQLFANITCIMQTSNKFEQLFAKCKLSNPNTCLIRTNVNFDQIFANMNCIIWTPVKFEQIRSWCWRCLVLNWFHCTCINIQMQKYIFLENKLYHREIYIKVIIILSIFRWRSSIMGKFKCRWNRVWTVIKFSGNMQQIDTT